MTARADLAAAIRAVNAAFNRLPLTTQESIDISDGGVDRLLDRCLLAGDEADARGAIDAWKHHYLQMFEEAVNE